MFLVFGAFIGDAFNHIEHADGRARQEAGNAEEHDEDVFDEHEIPLFFRDIFVEIGEQLDQWRDYQS